ncbi:hypothetical protein BC629DRAFT_1158935 [Irpex lacteus]|nr:hypothetical protein BC629DRAFT_1158935 [Irpex lacteus]
MASGGQAVVSFYRTAASDATLRRQLNHVSTSMFSSEQPRKKTTFNRDNFLSVKILRQQVTIQNSSHRITENYIDLDGHSHSFSLDVLFPDEDDVARADIVNTPAGTPVGPSYADSSSKLTETCVMNPTNTNELAASSPIFMTIDSSWNTDTNEARLNFVTLPDANS